MKDQAKLALVSRRYLRIKVFQALYAHHRTEGADLRKTESNLFASIRNLETLYLHLIKLLLEMRAVAMEITDENKRKKLPNAEDLNPSMRFINNRVFSKLLGNKTIAALLPLQKLSWNEEHDDLRRIYKAFRDTPEFRLYQMREDEGLETDKSILETLFLDHVCSNELIHNTLEDKDIYWQDDLPVAAVGVVKTIQNLPDNDTEQSSLLASLYKNAEEDQKFTRELLLKTVEFDSDYEKVISAKADNWEADRIALLDMLLMKMALCELEHFHTIPVKVTLNEYIELAKMYSTPKSKLFINGVLDKTVIHFKAESRINKRGRGLME